MSAKVENDNWPRPKFYFRVQLGDDHWVRFAEVSGLESETQVIEYRHADSPVFAPIKMPGLAKVRNVTLRKGMFVDDQKFWDWYDEIHMNRSARWTVVINLFDEQAKPKMTWTLNNAWPTKITGPTVMSETNEVAIELLELACETLTIAAP